MKLRELLFTGMDVPNETRKLLTELDLTNGMTDGELKAYEMGVENTLRVTRALLEQLDQPVFHASGYDVIEEFDLDDLIEFTSESRRIKL